MNQEVIDYFANKGRDVGKLVKKRPHTVTPMQVHKACEQFFERIKDGEQIKDLLITPIVYAMAKQLDAQEYATQIEKTNDLQITFEQKKAELQEAIERNREEHIRILQKNRIMFYVIESVTVALFGIGATLLYLGIL